MKIIAIIPARGGSKGVSRKNIRLMAGYPLIHYTIKCALAVSSINRTIVTTDDEEIAKISRQLGAETPFIRPAELACDETPDYPVVRHCLDFLSVEENYHPDAVVFLRPTMPMRTSDEIQGSIQILSDDASLDCVRTARPVPYPPFWMKVIKKDGTLVNFLDTPYNLSRRQDLPEIMMCDGYVDISRVSAINKYEAVVGGRIHALYRETGPIVDIDTQDDWNYCEYLMRKSNEF